LHSRVMASAARRSQWGCTKRQEDRLPAASERKEPGDVFRASRCRALEQPHPTQLHRAVMRAVRLARDGLRRLPSQGGSRNMKRGTLFYRSRMEQRCAAADGRHHTPTSWSNESSTSGDARFAARRIHNLQTGPACNHRWRHELHALPRKRGPRAARSSRPCEVDPKTYERAQLPGGGKASERTLSMI
jgi:hypothetical protein